MYALLGQHPRLDSIELTSCSLQAANNDTMSFEKRTTKSSLSPFPTSYAPFHNSQGDRKLKHSNLDLERQCG
jgi:hypothetical protein